MSRTNIAKAYIKHLAKGELEPLLSLFSADGIVVSPVYGRKNHQDFYTELFADTNNSELSTKGIFTDADSGNIALHFNYAWTLKNDSQVQFEVVDILEFNDQNKITVLTIIYDTVISRTLVQQLDK